MNQITLVSLLTVAISGPALFAQTPPPGSTQEAWISLLAAPGDSVDIRYQLEPAPTGWQVQFKNFGPAPVHFGFYLDGIQAADSVAANGRIHLPSSTVAGPFVPHARQAPSVLPKLRLVNIRVGDDEGSFWRE
jgi:hypothetical protein